MFLDTHVSNQYMCVKKWVITYMSHVYKTFSDESLPDLTFIHAAWLVLYNLNGHQLVYCSQSGWTAMKMSELVRSQAFK